MNLGLRIGEVEGRRVVMRLYLDFEFMPRMLFSVMVQGVWTLEFGGVVRGYFPWFSGMWDVSLSVLLHTNMSVLLHGGDVWSLKVV